jgi:hypothetical protein
MKNQFEQTRFTIETTEDGSPTLRLRLSDGTGGESMHHSGGAAAETEYIYKSVIEAALQVLPELKLAVVGLGLGYIEISWAIANLNNFRNEKKNGKKEIKSTFVSFEAEEDLKTNFLTWIATGKPEIYNTVCSAMDKNSSIDEIRKLLELNLQKFALKGDLVKEFEKDKTWNVICFDAFSKKTSEELWTEDFLNELLQKSCHEDCILTTYACTGALKRALKQNNFRLIERTRFKGKRDSTLAVRGIFNSSDLIFRTS